VYRGNRNCSIHWVKGGGISKEKRNDESVWYESW
jgi:hypothetical protein